MKRNPVKTTLWCIATLTSFVLCGTAMAYEYDDERDELTVKVGEVEEVTLWMGLKTVGRLQTFGQDDSFTPGARGEDGTPGDPSKVEDPEAGFQTPYGSMDFLAVFNDIIEVYWEFYISSSPHPSEMQGSQGYILFHGLPNGAAQPLFDFVDIKAGEFQVNFGDHIYRRSDNARVQRNAFVGNMLVDPRATEIGVEVSTKPAPYGALFGVTSGTESGDLTNGRGTALHGKVWGSPTEDLRVSGSIYQVDHSDNGASYGDGSRNNVYRTSRSGGQYAGILDDGSAAGQLFIGNGQDVFAYQGDVTLALGPLEIYGNVGYSEDADTNGSAEGSPEDSYMYYTVEGVLDLTENSYGAIRYTGAAADKLGGEDTDGYVGRIQVAVGYWLTDHILAKLEYVHQEYSDFNEGERASGVIASEEPSFDGVIAEVSLAF